MGSIEENKEEQRLRDARRIKALYTLLTLVVLGLLALLSVHAALVGPGSLLWDFAVNFFAIFSTAILVSGVIFPIAAAFLFLSLPVIFLAVYLRRR